MTQDTYSSVDELRARIARDADPVGALINIANGLPLRFIEVQSDGSQLLRLEHVSVAARLQVLRELKDALLPKVSRNQQAALELTSGRDWDLLITKRASMAPLPSSS